MTNDQKSMPSARCPVPNVQTSAPLGMGYWSLVILRHHLVILAAFLSGCAALTNPVANGIPVRRLPPELLGESKAGMETIPVSSLRQPPPEHYKLGPEDVLGIWIEGIMGEKGQA